MADKLEVAYLRSQLENSRSEQKKTQGDLDAAKQVSRKRRGS
jgi:hypothetical protein